MYRISATVSINTDINYIQGQKKSTLIGSKLGHNFNECEIKEKDVIDLHLGSNYYYRINDGLKTDLRGGGYFDPSRVEGLRDRFHYTGGAPLDLWRRSSVG